MSAKPCTIPMHVRSCLRAASTWVATARTDFKRFDRLDTLDSIDFAMRALQEARESICETLPEGMR